jgi:L-threonine-O-3-phosphate decarboxylase
MQLEGSRLSRMVPLPLRRRLSSVPSTVPCHGGNLSQEAARLGVSPERLLDASASLVPFTPPRRLRSALTAAIQGSALRDYPDRSQAQLRQAIAAWHGVLPEAVLPGNGAAELFTWVARDAAALGVSALPQPGFADYARALRCWDAASVSVSLPLAWPDQSDPHPWPTAPDSLANASVVWITNPHNPTGQLWSRASLEPLLARYRLVICDEAFLPLVPNGEQQTLIPLVADHPNLVVIRSLTKLFAVAGLRLGYAIAAPERLQRWSAWRDPWPVNGLALAAGSAVMADPTGLSRWQQRVQRWVSREGAWLQEQLRCLPGLDPRPSHANYVLVEGAASLLALREDLARRGVLLRDCRSFAGLGERWLRIGLQDRRGNRRIVRALRDQLALQPLI